MEKLENAFKVMDKILFWIVALLFGVMTLVIFLQVIFRYILLAPLPWSEELARYLFIWITFLGGTLAARKGNHIGMEMLQNALPGRSKAISKFIASFLTSIFFAMTFIFSISVFQKMMIQTSPAMELPMGYPYLGIIIGSALMCLWYGVYAFKQLKIEPKGAQKK